MVHRTREGVSDDRMKDGVNGDRVIKWRVTSR